MAPAPTLTDYLAGRTTPESGAVILGLAAAVLFVVPVLAGLIVQLLLVATVRGSRRR